MHREPTTPFTYPDESDDMPDHSPADTIAALVLALTDGIDPNGDHRTLHLRLSAVICATSRDPRMVEAMGPSAVAMRHGISRQAVSKAYLRFAHRLGLRHMFGDRLSNANYRRSIPSPSLTRQDAAEAAKNTGKRCKGVCGYGRSRHLFDPGGCSSVDSVTSSFLRK